jgi:hypothetical protein
MIIVDEEMILAAEGSLCGPQAAMIVSQATDAGEPQNIEPAPGYD